MDSLLQQAEWTPPDRDGIPFSEHVMNAVRLEKKREKRHAWKWQHHIGTIAAVIMIGILFLYTSPGFFDKMAPASNDTAGGSEPMNDVMMSAAKQSEADLADPDTFPESALSGDANGQSDSGGLMERDSSADGTAYSANRFVSPDSKLFLNGIKNDTSPDAKQVAKDGAPASSPGSPDEPCDRSSGLFVQAFSLEGVVSVDYSLEENLIRANQKIERMSSAIKAISLSDAESAGKDAFIAWCLSLKAPEQYSSENLNAFLKQQQSEQSGQQAGADGDEDLK